jgi:succinyl-diaminopimelate desuccinylase
VGDMKAGSVISLICLVLIHELAIPIKGQLTLTLVADEESSGRWGSEWLLENVPITRGTASLNSEPTLMDQVLIGHKGKYRLDVETHHEGGQAAMAAEDDAISQAMQVALTLKKLQGWKRPAPAEVVEAVERGKRLAVKSGQLAGKEWVADSTTVSVGLIRGGVQSNTIPTHCHMEIDLRTPVGVSTEDLKRKVEEVLDESAVDRDRIDLTWVSCLESAYSNPDEEIVLLTAANAREIAGTEIEVNVSSGSTDARFWWLRGIPAAIYGTGIGNIAVPDEYILEPEFETVLKVHAATCIDYLCG